MGKPTITSLHDRLQSAELSLSQLRRQNDEIHHRQAAILTALLSALRILWQLARLLKREALATALVETADTLKSETEPPRL